MTTDPEIPTPFMLSWLIAAGTPMRTRSGAIYGFRYAPTSKGRALAEEHRSRASERIVSASAEGSGAEIAALLAALVGSPVHGGPACRVCGCTDLRACPGGCSWAEADLCSRCAEPAAGRARSQDRR